MNVHNSKTYFLRHKTGIISIHFRLYHEEWRTSEVLVDQGKNSDNELVNFSFRGFKGDYSITLMQGDEELQSWDMNLETDTEWILSVD